MANLLPNCSRTGGYLRLAWLLFLVISGFASKFYQGWGQAWFNNSLGGVFYVTFWCSLWDFIDEKRPAFQIVVMVFCATAALEFLQLSQHPILEWVRGFFLGRTLIGTTFAPWDFFYYVIGALLGYSWMRWLRRRLSEDSRMASSGSHEGVY